MEMKKERIRVAENLVKASPLARSMAAAHGLELNLIPGTGPGGRIVRADILRAMESGAHRPM